MTRKGKLTKYVPDIGRSLFGILEGMRQRQSDRETIENGAVAEMILRLDQGEISETSIQACLNEAIETETINSEATASLDLKSDKSSQRNDALYIIPTFGMDEDASNDIHDELFSFRPIAAVRGR